MREWKDEHGIWWIQTKRQRERGVAKTCAICGNEFVTTCRPRQERKPRSLRDCESCGQPFKPERQDRRFCSVPCRAAVMRGEKAVRWKGGAKGRQSYVNVKADPSDPIAWAMRYASTDYVPEHRLVMARYLGRPLTRDEVVHHRNGVRYDNSLANLELWRTGHPMGQNVEDQVAWARDILERYGNYVPPSGQKRLL
jgi:hypothetical protein